jgi:hypothetical protein
MLLLSSGLDRDLAERYEIRPSVAITATEKQDDIVNSINDEIARPSNRSLK